MMSFNINFIALFLGFLFVLLLSFVITFRLLKKSSRAKSEFSLRRYPSNPILSPNAEHAWESFGRFNPAATKDDAGNVHLLYRAVGSDGVSRVGYASSKDGVNFDDELPHPVFVMENPRRDIPSSFERYDQVLYPSGGSWGGSEDPRMVRIDGRIYVTFNAFDGWDFIRIAVISIRESDFWNKQWKWSRPMFISPAKEIHKNWVLFPEKINGKFALLHSISPEVQIDYVDRLEDLAYGRRVINSRFGCHTPRKGWDSFRRGVGPPPIKTSKGWLVFYHAINKEDAHRYKLGAILLDLDNPRKVIAEAPEPLLVPDMWYENDWKPGTVYACGAVVKDDTLFVYYGGGDKYVCVATAPLQKILGKLVAV